MFGGIFQIVTDRDGHRHFYAHTDSAVVATLLVIALLLLILLTSTLCYYLTRLIMLWIVGRLARGVTGLIAWFGGETPQTPEGAMALAAAYQSVIDR